MTQDSISALLGQDGAPATIECGGRTYAASPVTQAVKSAWERWCKRKAFVEALDLTQSQSGAGEIVTRMAALGQFRWGSSFARQMLATEEGATEFGCMVLGCKPEAFAAMNREKPAELSALLTTLLEESFGVRKQEAGAEPNPTPAGPSSAATATTSGPTA